MSPCCSDNTYGLDRSVPIPQETVLTVNASGHVINSWGHGIFFLPHMITVDRQNNVWVTDVALHQV
jgi:peptidylamidoglycolate lyase